jgi:hypothetical protein
MECTDKREELPLKRFVGMVVRPKSDSVCGMKAFLGERMMTEVKSRVRLRRGAVKMR